MPQAATYRLIRYRFPGPLTAESLAAAAASWTAACSAAGLQPWGLFNGLLGLRTDELFAIAAAEDVSPGWPLLAGAETVERRELKPTARPVKPDSLTRPGVYVLRFFEIAPADVDRFVQLSVEAWTTFENTDDYRAEPVGLFRQDLDASSVLMLLVTWYDTLTSWERSRSPAPAARENFALRAGLTRCALPIATRLVSPQAS